MHYYQFNIGDYAGHTKHLNLLEDLAYRRLLDLYYLQESPMPDDVAQIARLIGMRENQDEVSQVLGDFFDLEDGFWINKRADDEIEKYRAKADTARENGKKGGRPKNQKKTQRVNLANPEKSGSKAKQETRNKKHKPITNLPSWLDQELWDGFMEIRVKLKATNTELAIKQLLNKLEKIKNCGFDPNQAISESIENSWKGVFEPKGKPAMPDGQSQGKYIN